MMLVELLQKSGESDFPKSKSNWPVGAAQDN